MQAIVFLPQRFGFVIVVYGMAICPPEFPKRKTSALREFFFSFLVQLSTC